MKKLSLDLERLTVESYDTTPATAHAKRGTVNALSAVLPVDDGSLVGPCFTVERTYDQRLCPIICLTPQCPTFDLTDC